MADSKERKTHDTALYLKSYFCKNYRYFKCMRIYIIDKFLVTTTILIGRLSLLV